MFRSFPTQTSSTSDLKIQLPNIKISTLSVPENSALVGKSLAKSQLRRKFGILVLAIRRNSQIISNPDRNTQICAEDELIVLGAPDKISELDRLVLNPQ
jgi:CPA2 family monovalent cation:H+ antiporter-2